MSVKVLEYPHEICLNHIPTILEERYRKPIKAWRLIMIHALNHLKDLLLRSSKEEASTTSKVLKARLSNLGLQE